jgi:hypothetical protein
MHHDQIGSTPSPRRWLALALVAGALTAGGCYKATFKTGLPPGGGVHDTKVTHFVWGLAGGGDVDVKAICPGGVSAVHTEKSFVDLLLASITANLNSPTSVQIECAGGATASAP